MGLFGKRKSARDWFNEGNDFYDKGNFLDAIECFDKVILDKKIHGKNIAVALNSKGRCIAKLEDFETAVKCFELAIGIDSESSDALFGKAKALQSMGQDDEAKKILEMAKKLELKK